MKKVYVVKTTETNIEEYYVKAKDKAEAEKIMKEKHEAEDEHNYSTHGKQVTIGCLHKSINFKVTDIKEMTPKDMTKALFCDEC